MSLEFLKSGEYQTIINHIQNGTLEQYKQGIKEQQTQLYKTRNQKEIDSIKTGREDIVKLESEKQNHEEGIKQNQEKIESLNKLQGLLDGLSPDLQSLLSKVKFKGNIQNDVAKYLSNEMTADEMKKRVLSRVGLFKKSSAKKDLANIIDAMTNQGEIVQSDGFKGIIRNYITSDSDERSGPLKNQLTSYANNILSLEGRIKGIDDKIEQSRNKLIKETSKLREGRDGSVDKKTTAIDNFVDMLGQIRDLKSEPLDEKYDEPVQFNLIFNSNARENEEAFQNAFKMLGADLQPNSEDVSKWITKDTRTFGGGSSIKEVWSPFMDPEKSDIKKFLKSLEILGFSSAMPEIVGIKQSDALVDIPDYHEINERAKEILGVTGDGEIDTTQLYKEITRKGSVVHGSKYDNADGKVNYILNGTMVSNDRYSLSPNGGRSSFVYGTKHIHHAAGYAGVHAGQDGESKAGGDKYFESNQNHIGLINVFENADNNFYSDRGLEGDRGSKDKIENPEKWIHDCETAVTYNNKHVAKLAVASYRGINGKEAYVYEYDRNDPKWQVFEELRQADIRKTWNENDLVYKRNRAQYQEMKEHGQVKTHDIVLPKMFSKEAMQHAEQVVGQTAEKS